MSTLQQNTTSSEETFLNFEQYDFAKDRKFQAGLPSILSRLSKFGSRLDKEVYDRELLKAKGFFYSKFISPFSFPDYLAWSEEKSKDSAPKCPFAHMWQNKGTQRTAEATSSSFITENSQDREGPVQLSLSSARTHNALKRTSLAKLHQNFSEYSAEDKITAFILDANCGGTDVVKDPSQLITTKDDRYFCNGLKYSSKPELDLQLYLKMAYRLYKLGETKPTVSLVNGLVDRNAIYLPWLCTDKLITEHARVTFSLSDDPASMLSNPVAGLYILAHMGQVDENKNQAITPEKQMPKGVALYVALCPDYIIRGPDMIKLLLGDCFIPSGKSQDLLESIKAVAGCPPPHTRQAIKVTYQPQNTYPGPSLIEVWKDEIEDCFSNVSGIEDILTRLSKYNNEWAKKITSYLRSQSPTFLKIVFKAISDASSLSFEECLKLEYRIAIKFQNTVDYKNVIDESKESSPRNWTPATLEEVTSEYIDTFFTQLTEAEGEELDFEHINQLGESEEEEEDLEVDEESEDSLVENKIGQSVLSQCPVTGLVFAKSNTGTDNVEVDIKITSEQEEIAKCPFMSGQKVEGQCPITGTKSTSDVTPPIVSNQPVEVQSPVTMEKLDLSTTEQETQSDIKQCPFMSGEKVTGQCPITGVSH